MTWETFIIPTLMLAYLATPLRNRAPIIAVSLLGIPGWGILVATSGLGSAALSIGLGISILVALGVLGITSRTSTLAIAAPLTCLPINAWVFSAMALVVAAVLAAILLRHKMGSGYFAMATGETLAAFGARGTDIGKPDLNRLPIEDPKSAKGGTRVNVPLTLLIANLVGLGVALYLSVT